MANKWGMMKACLELVEGMKAVDGDRKFDETVDFAEVEKIIDMPVKRYSRGMYVRLALPVWLRPFPSRAIEQNSNCIENVSS
jgi:ABC-type polysaccharide/polyol phosphate transport system ATPase subunit